MMKIRRKRSKEEKKITVRNIMITALVVLFFAGVILIYYSRLYRAEKDNIIRKGELTAKNSAEQIDRYLATNIDFIKLSAFTLDGMLKEHKSDEEIQEFLVGQSTAIRSAVDENLTGLYGYINGRFFSGTRWVPPEGYEATDRPWYTRAMEEPGQITMLDPYVDVQEGNTMIALGKTLADGKSVISVDVSLERIQKLMEEAVASGDSDIELFLNAKGTVVAHSKQSEVGRDYSAAKDSLGGLLFYGLAESRTNYVEVEHDGAHYIAYVADIRDGWRSVSVRDATGVIRSLKVLFMITIVLVLAVILIISVIMTKSNQRSIVAENLSGRLSSTADIYISVHEIDLMNDTFVQVRNTKAEAAEMIGKNRADAAQVIHDIVAHFSETSSREDMLVFVEFSTLDERLKDRNTITEEFLNLEKLWRKARFIVSARNEEGKVTKVMFMIEDIEEEKRAREKADEAINILNTRISSIANIYMTAHELDVATDTFTELKSESKIVNDVVGATRVHAQATIRKVMETVSHPASLEDVIRFIDLSTLEKRLKNKNTISVEYMNKSGLWRRGRFIVSGRDAEGRLTRVLWLSEDIDSEKKERDRLIDMSERAIAANEAKSAFLSNMSHELRIPINAILGMNEVILRECQDEKLRSCSENIESTGSKLLSLVNDILDFSGIEAGKLEIVSGEYDLPALIDGIAEKIRPKAEEKDLSFVLDREDDLPAVLIGDETRIRQVISNMLASAIKYTEKGSVILGIRHRFSEEEPGCVFLDIYVQDTGAGIKPEDIPELFSEFGHIGFGDSKEDAGAGIGMNITYKLLALMGAKLQVDSVYGIGSKFYFSLKQKAVK